MENITLGTIGAAIAFIVALLSGISYLNKQTKSYITASMKEQMESIDKRFDNVEHHFDTISSKLDKVDRESTKNFLVQTLSQLEKGVWVDEMEKKRIKEQYDHYIDDLHGNTYIKEKYEDLRKKGMI